MYVEEDKMGMLPGMLKWCAEDEDLTITERGVVRWKK